MKKFRNVLPKSPLTVKCRRELAKLAQENYLDDLTPSEFADKVMPIFEHFAGEMLRESGDLREKK